MEQVVQRAIKKDRDAREKVEGEQAHQRASMNFAIGRSEAMKANPELFKGIERQLEQGMWNYWKANKITIDELGRSKTWENGARMIHMANEDYERIVPRKPVIDPVSSAQTETPNARQKELPDEDAPIELDEFGKELLAHRPEGMSEADFLKQVRETKKKAGR